MREFSAQGEALGLCRGGAGAGRCCCGSWQVAHLPPGLRRGAEGLARHIAEVEGGFMGPLINTDFSYLPCRENSEWEDKWEK